MELGLAFLILSLPYLLFNMAESIRFEVESGHTKCISEDIKANSMTVGQYSVVNPNEEQGSPLPQHYKITAMLFSGKGNRYHNAENVETGQFALDVVKDGDHVACFSALDHQPAVNISVEFNWRSGVAAKDWTNVAKKGSVDAMEIELRKMRDTVASIHMEMFLLRQREQQMQELNRNTNTIMGYLSFISLFMCLSVASLQVWHLKSFFEKQKII
uniref:transmembrane emp24 domain-containing protein p24delta9-like n=1 Tax=Erigeron canadensis TaxID=72917 RepID=UPI001CB89658|nr:transmembrane emp24 domain-containing protein p24delta9-like [Erigeron canadensis]